MADDRSKMPVGRGTSMGRGSLLDMLKKRNEKTETPSAPPSVAPSLAPSPTPSPDTSVPSVGRGRATLLGMSKKPPEQPVSTTSQGSDSVQSGQSRGRASLLGMMKKPSVSPGPSSQASSQPAPAPQPVPGPAGDSGEKVTTPMASLQITESVTHSEPVSRSGAAGAPVQLHANYIRLSVQQGRGVFEYEVKFSPDLDSRPLRSKLLAQHSVTLGDARTFDGVTLYLPHPLGQPRTELQSQHPMDGTTVNLSVIFKRQRKLGEVVTLYNVLLRRILYALNLVQIGRQHFNANAAESVPQHKLELWPGYVTAIDEYEGGLQLCLQSTHRVLRTETVRDLINDVYQRQGGSGRARDAVTKELMGVSVLTRYNNKVYRVDDIEWNATPMKEFTLKKEEKKITLVDYYKSHWNLEIRDKQQPLLIHRAKMKTPSGEQYEQLINLIPELCYMSGLTETMRQDFKIMKDVATITRITPEHRVKVAHRFVEEVKKNEVACKLLANWGLSLEDKVVAFKGRRLDPETILFGNKETFPAKANQNADWNNVVCRMPMLSTPGLKNWCLLYCKRDSRIADDFHNILCKASESMGMRVAAGKLIELRDDRTETFLKILRENISPMMELMVVIFPTNRNDRYAAVKKLCCVEMPIASQVIIGRTLSKPDKIKSVTQKIALQINCKLGGTLWALQTPLDNCMVCGIDVHHAGAGQSKHGSVAGFVASLDKPFTRWFSKVCLHRPNQELIDSLKVCLVSALRAYYKVNNRFPNRIIIYRDGVGDGQLEVVKNFEVKQLEESFTSIAPDYQPRLSVVIVQKRINTRIFQQNGRRIDNPAPGTIVDHTVTRRDYYDFFLVSQNVRQGTVSPTHYLVIHDKAELNTDQLQRLTHKLCHLYYNWPGTVRVPAPCQYAHKLAFLVGESVQMEPHNSLSDKLYFL